MSDWYRKEASDVLSNWESDATQGLSDSLAGRRKEEYGPNELIETGGRSPDDPIRTRRTIIFTVLTFSQMGHVLAIRTITASLFRIGIFSNPLMLAAVGLTFVLQIALIYIAPLQTLFYTTALNRQQLLLCLVLSSVVFWGVEAQKWWHRFRHPIAETVAETSSLA